MQDKPKRGNKFRWEACECWNDWSQAGLLQAYWINPNLIQYLSLFFIFTQPALSSFTSFVAASLISPSPLQRFSLTCIPFTPWHSSALLSLLYHLKLMERITAVLKIVGAATWFIFSPSLSLSRRFSIPKVPPLFLLFFRASLGREVSNGVMACQLIYQLVEPCAALAVRRLQRDYGSGWQSPSAACSSRSLLYGQGATGQKVNMNQWPMFIRAGRQQTLPWASASRPGIHQITLVVKDRQCAGRISIREQEEMITGDRQHLS